MSIGKGFTLVEMVVVIAIVGLLSTGAVGGYHYVCRQQMVQAAKEIQSTIEIMQQKAALRKGRYQLERFEVDGQSVLTLSRGTKIESKYKAPTYLKVYIGTQNNYFASGKRISFNGDVSPFESGTLTVWHKQIPYYLKITVQPVTGVVTIYPIQKNPGGKMY